MFRLLRRNATATELYFKKSNSPKFAIANGFVVGSFPEFFSYTHKDSNEMRIDIDIEEDLNDILLVLLAPITPYGFLLLSQEVPINPSMTTINTLKWTNLMLGEV